MEAPRGRKLDWAANLARAGAETVVEELQQSCETKQARPMAVAKAEEVLH